VRADVYDLSMMTGGGSGQPCMGRLRMFSSRLGQVPPVTQCPLSHESERVIEGELQDTDFGRFRFDTGLRSDLSHRWSIGEASTGVAMQMFAPTSHRFFAWLRSDVHPRLSGRNQA